MSKAIALPNGFEAIVDENDYESIKGYTWGITGKRNIYASRKISNKGAQKKIYMHKDILGVGPGQMVDHINGNSLDNRRSNLRLCIHAENMRNSKKRKDSKNPYKGIRWVKKHKRWEARIKQNGKHRYLGYYKTPEEAETAYNDAAKNIFGEFSRLNELPNL